MSEEMFQEAMQAARSGQRRRAKDLLTRLLKSDSSNVDYWLWMSAVVESEKEQVFCLQKAVKLDPNSVAARRGLVVLGALRPEEAALPPAQSLEHIRVDIPELKTGGGLGGFLSRPRNREMLMIFGLGGVAVVLVVALGLFLVAPNLFRPRNVVVVTNTPRPIDTLGPTALAALTSTLPPCSVPSAPNAATPLAIYLCLTQTPTAVAIPTERTLSEDYNTIIKAYTNRDWDRILSRESVVTNDRTLSANPTLNFYLGEAYRHKAGTQNLSKAVSYYRSALRGNASFAPAHWGKALAELARNNVNEALKDFDNAIRSDPNFYPAYMDRGLFYSANGNFPRALGDLQQAQVAAPGNALVLANLALAYADNRIPRQAMDLADEALAIDPGLPLAYYARGRAAYALGQFELADQDLTLSHKYVMASEALFPKLHQATVLYHYGLGKLGIRDDAAALAAFDQALSLYNAFPLAHVARGNVYLRREEYSQARADFNTAIGQFQQSDANNPALIQAYLGNGLALLGLNRPDSALSNFQVVVRNEPTNFEGFLGLGQSWLLTNRAADALPNFAAALELAETDDQLARTYFWRAQAHQALGRTRDQVSDLAALAALSGAPTGMAPTAAAQLTDIGPLPSETPTGVGMTGTPSGAPAGTATPTARVTSSDTPAATGSPGTPTRTPSRSPTRRP